MAAEQVDIWPAFVQPATEAAEAGTPLRRQAAVRSFVAEDIPQVADLYRRVFLRTYPEAAQPALTASLAAYFADLFFSGRWEDDFISSLVCEDFTGQVIGFIGVVPRRMTFKGRTIHAANCFHFMADPAAGAVPAGVRLLKSLFAGPQDVTFSDHGGDIGRRVWEGLGGSTAYVQSFNWVRLLRPTRHALNWAMVRKPALAALARLSEPVCRSADALLAQFGVRPLSTPSDDLIELPLDERVLLLCLERFSSPYTLRPQYDREFLGRLLTRAKQLDQAGALQTVALRRVGGEIIGSYLYYLKPGGVSKVMQVTAKKGAAERVLDHLFEHARRRGATALTGRLDPRWMREMTNKHCYFDGSGGWTLVHAHDQELLQAARGGDAFLSRLEGEWCMLYQPPAAG